MTFHLSFNLLGVLAALFFTLAFISMIYQCILARRRTRNVQNVIDYLDRKYPGWDHTPRRPT